MSNKLQTDWMENVKRVRFLVNFAWWLKRYMPIQLIFSLVFTVFVFISKRYFPGIYSSNLFWAIYGVGTALVAYLSFHYERTHFFGERDAVIHLDDHLHLNTRLVNAYDGNSAWPFLIFCKTCFRASAWL